MKGEVEKVWKNETQDGRKYEVLQINGERYSIWEEDYLDRIQEGQTLEFDFKESGDFKNITRIYEKPETGPEEKRNEYEDRNRKIIRMSCLRSASRVLTGSRIPSQERAEKTIEIAKRFEKYIDEDLAGFEDDQKP